MPPRLLLAPASQRFSRRVQRLDTAPDVGGNHRIADRLQGDLRTLLLGEQLCLIALVFGDIGERAGHAHGPAVGTAHQPSARAHPQVPAPARTQPELGVIWFATAQMAHKLVVERIQVGGVEQSEQRFARMRHGVRLESQHLRAARREIEPAAAHVPVPQAVIAAANGQLQAFLAPGQRFTQPPLAPQPPLRQQDGRQQQRHCHHDNADGKPLLNPPRSLAQLVRECRLQRRQPRIDGNDALQHRLDAHHVTASLADQLTQHHCLFMQGRDLAVAFGPDADCGIYFLDMVEVAVETNDARYVVGVDGAGEKAGTRAS